MWMIAIALAVARFPSCVIAGRMHKFETTLGQLCAVWLSLTGFPEDFLVISHNLNRVVVKGRTRAASHLLCHSTLPQWKLNISFHFVFNSRFILQNETLTIYKCFHSIFTNFFNCSTYQICRILFNMLVHNYCFVYSWNLNI